MLISLWILIHLKLVNIYNCYVDSASVHIPWLNPWPLLTLWRVVAGYGVLNITMARVAIINYVNEAAPSESNCEVMKQVPGLGQPRIHEYGEY